MSDQTKWTVRNFDSEALGMLRRVRDTCGQTLGSLLSDAIRAWYADLPEIEDDE
jgi:hypothetical protein